jgi:hypothetical protein
VKTIKTYNMDFEKIKEIRERFINNNSEKSREYWRNLGILIGDEFRWISKYEN